MKISSRQPSLRNETSPSHNSAIGRTLASASKVSAGITTTLRSAHDSCGTDANGGFKVVYDPLSGPHLVLVVVHGDRHGTLGRLLVVVATLDDIGAGHCVSFSPAERRTFEFTFWPYCKGSRCGRPLP